MLLAPAGLQVARAMTGLPLPGPLTLNVCISNVPGPTKPLYWRGARLEATYPVSIPGHSMALNITAQSYAGTLNLGFIGDREAVPHLQRLAVHTGEALEELEAAIGTGRGVSPAGGSPLPMLTIHAMPNRSTRLPYSSPHICFSKGIVTVAPSDSPSQYRRSASSSPLSETWTLLGARDRPPSRAGGPRP